MSLQASDSPLQQSIERRATALFQAHQQAIYQRTDRMFVVLLGVQWLTGIVFALLISPRAWYGTISQTHLHVWAALFLGGGISLFPIVLGLLRRNLRRSSTAVVGHNSPVAERPLVWGFCCQGALCRALLFSSSVSLFDLESVSLPRATNPNVVARRGSQGWPTRQRCHALHHRQAIP